MILNQHQFHCLRVSLTVSTLLFSIPALLIAGDATTFVGLGDGTSWVQEANWDNGVPDGNNTNINGGFNVMLSAEANTAELDIGGNAGNTDGLLDHSAGALSGSGWLKVGLDGNTGTYNLSGTASASGFSNTFVGAGGGIGNMSISNSASFSAGEIVFAGTGGLVVSDSGSVSSSGELRLEQTSTGNVSTSSTVAVQDVIVRNSASFELSNGMVTSGTLRVENNANVDQTGGSVTTDQWVSIGNVSGDTANYHLSAGSLTSNGDWLSVGENGSGNLNVSGNAAVDSEGNGIIVGRNGTGVGLLEIDGSGASVEGNDLRVGINSDGNDDGGTGTLSWIADPGGVSDIVSFGNTEFGANANLLVDLTDDADFGLFGAGGALQEVLLIDNASAVSGTFAGLGEGASVKIGGGKFATISYVGGSDNFDVVLQVLVPEPSSILWFGLAALGLVIRRRRK